MIQSMTGFGKAEVDFSEKKITVEIKSLNSKQLDVNTRIPTAYKGKDMEIRNLLSQSLERGKVDFIITLNAVDKSVSGVINQTVVKNYYEEIKDLSEKLNIALPSEWFSIILRLPDAIKPEITEPDEKEWLAVKQTIYKALDSLNEFRRQEGIMLENVFITKINNINRLLKDIEQYETERVEKIKFRVADSLAAIDSGSYDTNRLEQELIFYIEKLDINEEKSRMVNHLDYFVETLQSGNSQGRKLGFIAQEIGREINTLGSKSNHALMQRIVVQMKDELEQIKEQIFNVL
ncbi:MAG: YicC family protein [Dysgonamonadaceae bacterium]|nr:YicC family protein [Dysgonamonadaceae bacterium]